MGASNPLQVCNPGPACRPAAPQTAQLIGTASLEQRAESCICSTACSRPSPCHAGARQPRVRSCNSVLRRPCAGPLPHRQHMPKR